ncbi:hypothetical protein DL89DRAFT_263983 [Linderina pennispora]|uniref:Uncharacterized protein n=1 Tax=Linderina pennispora TaxID=61395 RepID=A0A1Y1WK67_9FUNG|nr:uncharacterized protein DL89DRAFT_263983 [Linderina pennispora]ORX73980.1 hypothetical protein DL89DRAFT_263983 [Linderina pennispora]
MPACESVAALESVWDHIPLSLLCFLIASSLDRMFGGGSTALSDLLSVGLISLIGSRYGKGRFLWIFAPLPLCGYCTTGLIGVNGGVVPAGVEYFIFRYRLREVDLRMFCTVHES